MSSEGSKPFLPAGPSGLCFNRDEFLKDGFSIDRFVAECRRNVPLETLREDLAIYMRLLRTAMVELINQDYADFVNLSSNLVGLDKAIGNLSEPLNQLRGDVSSAKLAVNAAVDEIGQKLDKLKQIREQKASLQLLMTSVQCFERLENQMKFEGDVDDKQEVVKLDGDVMERMSAEFNRLHFIVTKSSGLPLIEDLKPKIQRITNILQRNLEDAFLKAYGAKDSSSLRQCLRIYATINKTKGAEDLFRKKIIAAELENVISDSVWKNHPQGLRGMYSKVLELIRSHCLELCSLTQPKYGGESVSGFDFLVNAVFPEVVSAMEVRTPLLCDLTNPKTFHERYFMSVEFLERFEEECGSAESVTRLRDHASYSNFISRWNLAVYFQIRFQEIAGTLETSLGKPLSARFEIGGDFLLPQTQTLWQCVVTCWRTDVYLRPLVHRFWKLTMLLWSRYITWTSDALKFKAIRFPGENDAVNGSQDGEWPPANGVPSKDSKEIILAVVALVADIHALQKKIPDYVCDVVVPHLDFGSDDKSDLITDCVADTLKSLERLLPRLDTVVTDEVTSRALGSLKLVNDIPRLFRRTNRDVPNNPSAYVVSALKPLQSFFSDHVATLPTTPRHAWTRTVVENITNQYLSLVSDVLTSVKKMEDSLKRFKMARDNKTSSATSSSSSSSASATINANMSDDDKIRTQLAIDVRFYCTQIRQLEIGDLASIHQLTEIVELAQNSLPS